MSFKAETPLDRIDVLDDDAKAALRKADVTTVEELVGRIERDPEALAALLDVPPSEVKRIRKSASEVIPPHVWKALTAAPASRAEPDALDPNTR